MVSISKGKKKIIICLHTTFISNLILVHSKVVRINHQILNYLPPFQTPIAYLTSYVPQRKYVDYNYYILFSNLV